MKRIGFLTLGAVAILCLGIVGVRADSTGTTSTTSHWQVYAWVGQETVNGVLTMTRTGNKVVGAFRDNAITGELVDDGNQLNGTWTGPRGSGWITLHFHDNGNGFDGTWGQKGKPSDGKLVGGRVTPSPAPAGS